MVDFRMLLFVVLVSGLVGARSHWTPIRVCFKVLCSQETGSEQSPTATSVNTTVQTRVCMNPTGALRSCDHPLHQQLPPYVDAVCEPQNHLVCSVPVETLPVNPGSFKDVSYFWFHLSR